MRVVDLTHTLAAGIPDWETASTFAAEHLATIDADGFTNRLLHLDEHTGTHIDAPAHLLVSGKSVTQIDPQRLLSPLAVVDFREAAALSPDATLPLSHLLAFEAAHGRIPQHAAVLLRTGWESRWSKPLRYRNPDGSGCLHFPGYSLEAARWLVEERKVNALGIDTLSVDTGCDVSLPVHHFCLQKDVYLLENVANLDALPPLGVTLIVAPLKIEDGSGAPARLLALIEK